MNLGLIFLGLIILGIIIGVAIFLWRRNSNKGFTGANKGKTAKDYKNNTGKNAYLPTPSWGKFIPNQTQDGNCLSPFMISLIELNFSFEKNFWLFSIVFDV